MPLHVNCQANVVMRGHLCTFDESPDTRSRVVDKAVTKRDKSRVELSPHELQKPAKLVIAVPLPSNGACDLEKLTDHSGSACRLLYSRAMESRACPFGFSKTGSFVQQQAPPLLSRLL